MKVIFKDWGRKLHSVKLCLCFWRGSVNLNLSQNLFCYITKVYKTSTEVFV